MFIQIFIGSVLLLINVTLAAVAAMLLELFFARSHAWLLREPHRPKLVLVLVGVSMWILAMVTVGVWIWAAGYRALGVFSTMEESVYFSLVCFTTLGFGDVLLHPEWRLLAGMEAANGFLNFGLLTALLVEAMRQVRLGQVELRRKRDV